MIRTHEVIEAIVALLKADPSVTEQVTTVHAHRLPVPPATGSWNRIVVRELALPDGLPEHVPGHRCATIQVMVETNSSSPDAVLSETHNRIEEVLRGKRIATAHSRMVLPVERSSTPSVAQHNEATRAFYSTARYLVTLLPSSSL